MKKPNEHSALVERVAGLCPDIHSVMRISKGIVVASRFNVPLKDVERARFLESIVKFIMTTFINFQNLYFIGKSEFMVFKGSKMNIVVINMSRHKTTDVEVLVAVSNEKLHPAKLLEKIFSVLAN